MLTTGATSWCLYLYLVVAGYPWHYFGLLYTVAEMILPRQSSSAKHVSFINGGIRRRSSPDQTIAVIDRDAVLIAKGRDAVPALGAYSQAN